MLPAVASHPERRRRADSSAITYRRYYYYSLEYYSNTLKNKRKFVEKIHAIISFTFETLVKKINIFLA